MGIVQFPTPIPATVGTLPTLKFMVTSDNLATIVAPGYLNNANLDAANPISNSDVIMTLYNYNTQTGNGTFGTFVASVLGGFGQITLGLNSGLKTASVTLTAAQVLAMFATPQLIVASPGTGLAVIPTACQITTLVGTAAFAGGGAAQLQWGNTVHAGGTLALDATTPAAEITAAASQVYTQYGLVTTTVSPIANMNGLGLYFSNVTGAFTGGAGSTVNVTVSYMIIPV
jgi:hypothetical protein